MLTEPALQRGLALLGSLLALSAVVFATWTPVADVLPILTTGQAVLLQAWGAPAVVVGLAVWLHRRSWPGSARPQ